MAAYDRLPPAVRRALASARYGLPVDVVAGLSEIEACERVRMIDDHLFGQRCLI
jgi:hypothetical protein